MARLLRFALARSREWLFKKSAHLRLKLSVTKDLVMVLLGRKKACYLTFSFGIKRISALPVLLESALLYVPANCWARLFHARLGRACLGVVTWGVKEEEVSSKTALPRSSFFSFLHQFFVCRGKSRQERALFALNFAKENHIPLLRVEDGFLRSLDLGVKGAEPLSLIIDHKGMYYDAGRESELEALLNSDHDFSGEYERAQRAIAAIQKYSLSKYNHAPVLRDSSLFDPKKRHALLIDQTFGDMSVIKGLASEDSFRAMLSSALAREKDAQIVIKVHPDVLSGKKKGYLAHMPLPKGIVRLSEDIAPLSLLAKMDAVYTVTSQMGFEALLLGKEVHCFGMPFYAGYGLTHDSMPCPRPRKKRSFLDLFCASYLSYARYVSPLGRPSTLEETIDLLAEQRRMNEANRGYHACFGFRKWKHGHTRAFLASTGGETEFFLDEEAALQKASKKKGVLVVWAAGLSSDLWEKAERRGIPLWQMEDGFLRSVGLGSNYQKPGSLVLDHVGIYFDPSRESLLERILNEERSPEELERAQEARSLIVEKGVSKYNVSGKWDVPPLPKERRILLVPGQVEDDASVKRGGLGIHSNTELLREVRKANPSAFILYKEHPDVVSGNRMGKLRQEDLCDGIVRTCPIEEVLPLCHEVHTLTSLTGFEALLRGIPVFTYGGPFYAGWGLTHDRHLFPRRRPLPSLNHLIAGTLLVYPRYYDWNHKMFLDMASYLELLAKQRFRG